MEIAVLIPCYNEELSIQQVILDFQKFLPEAKIYVYDNNSTDKTAEIAKKTKRNVELRNWLAQVKDTPNGGLPIQTSIAQPDETKVRLTLPQQMR